VVEQRRAVVASGSGGGADPAMSRALVFIGFMGAGKTTVAREVASALGEEARDADRLLEAQLGESI
jgi:tRNA A37 threonylcarbamoyladenosine biosynthesis protein TsaE